MKITTLTLAGVSLGAVALLFGPATETAEGFSLLGSVLGLGQRDVRVFDNFSDSTADDNNSAQSNFPGGQGVELAIWKSIVEWGSLPHGNGAGDPLQGTLGNGGANFDATWQGNASGIGNTNQNIVSTIASCGGGGTLAFVETPVNDGWRMRFCEEWTWQDNSGSPGSAVDIQSVATHEYGHSLGLGHSTVGGSTMFPSYSGTGSRSISSDDINGIRAAYGVATASKVTISNVVVAGTQVTITGTNFSSTNNRVWFTNNSVTTVGVDPRIRVTGISSTAGGTQIVVNAPTGAGPGDVLVRNSGGANEDLSNAWPINVNGGGGPGGAFMVTSVSPANIDALIPGTSRTITINGDGFTATSQVSINGTLLTGIPNPVLFVSPQQLTLDMPQIDNLGLALFTVTEGSGTGTVFGNIVAPAQPKLQIGSGDIGSAIFQFAGLDITLASQPNDLVYLVYSTSGMPSVLPGVVSLGLGAGFTNIPPIGTGFFSIPNKGWTNFNLPISGITSLPTVYSQMVRVTGGAPYDESNLQQFIIF